MEKTNKTMQLRKKYLRDNFHPLPADGLPPFSTNLNFYHAVVESNVADKELVIKRVYRLYKRIHLTNRWDDVEENKENLRNMFINVNKTVKENKASCSRFKEKIREKSKDKMSLEAQIYSTRFDIKEYKDVKVEMEKYVNEYSIYENFLKGVSQTSLKFNSVGDVLNRYETLEHTRRECALLLKNGLEETLQLRKTMASLVDEKTSILKNLNNKLIMMQVRRKQAKEKLMYWENTVQRIKSEVGDREEQRVNLGGACWDLYQEMCTRRKVAPTASERDIETQMKFIKKTLLFYKEVITIATSVKQALQAQAKMVSTTAAK